MFRKLFGRKRLSEEEEERLENEWYEKKSGLMEALLGKEHDMVMHAVIPYEIGGALDLYYYPNGISGTGVATKELSFACRDSSTNDWFEKYELVMFTREQLDLDQAQDESSPFGEAHQNISSILNPIARYSEEAKLNPNETCEFPSDIEGIGGKCLIFSAYETAEGKSDNFGLLAIIEVFRSEMEYAMDQGGDMLLGLLKEKGIYPYSDMNREPVI
jgi:hypothetical protein